MKQKKSRTLHQIETRIVKRIIELLMKFLLRKFTEISNLHRENSMVIHYYQEIIRYWNRINYIIQTILSNLYHRRDSTQSEENIQLMALYLYATYRNIWESTSHHRILKELDNFFISNEERVVFGRFLEKLTEFDWQRALRRKSNIERLSLEEAVPTFVVQHLNQVMPLKFLRENLRAMNSLADQRECTIRINTVQDTNQSDLHSQIMYDLKQEGIHLRQDTELPELFHISITKKSQILQNRWYKLGYLIFQDKASAMVAKILDSQPREIICDMCAAPGMKTSLIAQYTNNQATIFAVDVHLLRTIQMKHLLKQLHALNIHIINADSITFPLKSGVRFDRVLLDAPCTGSGTFLTNPALKWRQNKKFLEQNRYFQLKLLESALNILKPRGILVYATCSLYPEEGELQILRFLNQLDPMELPDWIAPSYKINKKPIPGTGRLFPAIHRTQGFFIAKFQKSA